MKYLILSVLFLNCCFSSGIASQGAGMLYFASYGKEATQEVIDNPYIIGGLYTLIWSEVEPEKGKYDWSAADAFIERWARSGKKTALRIIWSTSGYWNNPAARRPTPEWVWDEGARYAYHEGSDTQIPLFWDPVYRSCAMELLREINSHFGDNKDILFIDVTPGAETNPYRFGTIHRRDPGYKAVYEATKASDGRTYTDELWRETVLDWINRTAEIVSDLPCLVTLNVGSLKGTSYFQDFGQCAVDHGMYVGQNGIKEGSYEKGDNERKKLFERWAKTTKLFFEMVHAAETANTGTLQGVMDAARRIHCSYLNVYAVDVMKSTPGHQTYDSRWEQAMKSGDMYFRSLEEKE